MNKFIKIYKSEFAIEEEQSIARIRYELVDGKKNNYTFNYILNMIISQGSELKNKFLVNNSFHILYNSFNNRTSKYDDANQYDFIHKDLKTQFESSTLKAVDYGFRNYVKDLGTYEAIFVTYNHFRNHSDIYKLMYKLNKFDGYEFQPYFKIENYAWFKNHSNFKKELKLNLKEITNNNSVEINTDYEEEANFSCDKNLANDIIGNPSNSNKPVIKFDFKPDYGDRFTDERVYAHLTDYYLNPDLTSLKDFTNIFSVEDFEKNSSRIHFYCSSQLASLLLFTIGVEFFKNLSLVNIHKSEKFITSNNKNFKRINLSNSKSKATTEERNEVAKTIDYIKNLK
jgi:hypothetical protein